MIGFAASSALTQTVRYKLDTSVADNPTVADNRTGLMWQGCAAGLSGDDCTTGDVIAQSWMSSLRYCDTLSWGGYDDWRLPNAKELMTIIDNHRYRPSIDPAVFPATPAEPFWSSSSDVEYNDQAWASYFNHGGRGSLPKENEEYARCVRGGGTT